VRRALDATEILDGPVSPADRDASLADIERLNAWFGGYWLSLRALAVVARAAGDSLLVVDVGGGRGDFARRIAAWAARRGRRARVVVVDRDFALLARARARRAGVPVEADARALPLRRRAADVVTTSLTLHHLSPDGAVRTLAEMGAVARGGVVINDLWRSRLTLALVWLATRVLARHRFSRHDGPVSVRRAYSARELEALARRAGLRRVRVRRYRLLGRVLAVVGA
jgi:ubiquinone/menaquinone biosynthesis C-methylase UbiE